MSRRRWSQDSFVDEVPRLLAERGMSLRALGRAAGVDIGLLSRILRRRDYKTATGDVARRIASSLDLPDDYFPEYREAIVATAARTDAELRDKLYRSIARDEATLARLAEGLPLRRRRRD